MQERILIVEDDAIAQLTLTQYLSSLGFPHSVAVNNGPDAIAAFAGGDIALVFLDIRIMGEWNGITTAQRIRRQYPKVPLIFLTANTDQETLRRTQQVSSSSVIRKPYDRDTLLKVVNEALHPHEAPPLAAASSSLAMPSLEDPTVGISVTNAEGHLVSVNASFCQIHHCDEADATGQLFTNFLPQGIRKFAMGLHREFMAERTEEGGGVWTIVDQQGALQRVSTTVHRLLLGKQQRYKITTFVDLSQQQDDTKRLEMLLEEKNAFAREIHHRVKNNLNVISGLFYLQAEKIKDRPEVYQLFQESISRIRTMSVVHEQLYDYENYATVDLRRYVQLLADSVQATYRNMDQVTLHTDVDSIQLDVDRAVACGLILNEAMTNSFKYAFTDAQTDANVTIKSFCRGQAITLTVEDNGVGVPAGFNIGQVKTLGIQLIKTLTGQLGGTVDVQNASPRGTRVSLTFATKKSPTVR